MGQRRVLNIMMRMSALNWGLAVMLLVASGCSPFGSSGRNGGTIDSVCADLQLSSNRVVPLDRVELVGLDPVKATRPIGDLYVLFQPVGSEDDYPLPVTVHDDGRLSLIAPSHPDGVGGGRGRLRLTDGDGLVCPALPVTVTPVETAPGETERVVELIERSLRRRVELAGVDPNRLESLSASDLPLMAVPPAVALWALDGRNNPDRLRGQLEDTDTELLDALLARGRVVERLQEQMAVLDAAPERANRGQFATLGPFLRGAPREGFLNRRGEIVSPLLEAAQRLMGGRGELRAQVSAAPVLVPGTWRASATMQVLNIPPVQIRDANELSYYMGRQAAAAGTMSGPTGDMLGDLGSVISVIGIFAPGVGAAAGAVHFLYMKGVEADRQLLPCCFEKLDFERSKVWFEEDYPWPDRPAFYARWGQVEVDVHNMGWNLTQTAIEAGFAALGTGKGARDAWKNAAARRAGNGVSTDVVGGAQEGLVDSWLQQNVRPEIQELTVPRHDWRQIDISGAQWSEAEVPFRSGDAITTVSTHGYGPRDLGSADLRVKTRSRKFGSAHIWEDKPVEVREIGVSVVPTVRRVTTGEEIEMRGFIRHSFEPKKARWTIISANGAAVQKLESGYRGEGEHYQMLKLPDEEEAFPITVELDSTTTTGLRNGASDRRYGSATLTTGAVVDIGPDTGCVEQGETLAMFAEVFGVEDTRLRWSASGPGSVSQEGVLTSSGDGEVTVRAVSVADPEAFDEAHIDVGGCTCRFSLQISGDSSRAVNGSIAHYSTTGEGSIVGAFTTPGAWGDTVEGMFGEEMAEQFEQMQRQGQAEAGGRETLGVSVMEGDPEREESMLAAIVGGATVQVSVMNQPIQPGFSGALKPTYVMVTTGEYSEGGYPIKYEWSPASEGELRLFVSQYTGRSLQAYLVGQMTSSGIYLESTGESLRVHVMLDLYALQAPFGCLSPELASMMGN